MYNCLLGTFPDVELCADDDVLYVVVAIDLVEQQLEGFAAQLLQVLFHKRHAWIGHARDPVAHEADNGNVVRYAQSLADNGLECCRREQSVIGKDGIG